MIWKRRNSRDGITYWFIRYDLPDGRRRKEKAGTTRRDAEELLITRKAEILKGTYVDPRRRALAEGTFDQFADRFLEDYGRLRRSRYYLDALSSKSPLRKFFGDRLFAGITAEDLDRFRRWRSTQVGPSTVRKNLTVLGTMFKQARRWGIIDMDATFRN